MFHDPVHGRFHSCIICMKHSLLTTFHGKTHIHQLKYNHVIYLYSCNQLAPVIRYKIDIKGVGNRLENFGFWIFKTTSQAVGIAIIITPYFRNQLTCSLKSSLMDVVISFHPQIAILSFFIIITNTYVCRVDLVYTEFKNRDLYYCLDLH